MEPSLAFPAGRENSMDRSKTLRVSAAGDNSEECPGLPQLEQRRTSSSEIDELRELLKLLDVTL
jgi:hypothetical protein